MSDTPTPTQEPPKLAEPPKAEGLWSQASARTDTDLSFAIEAWKHTVSVQMHFNDICMKLRNLAITGLAAIIGLAAYSTKERIEIDVFGITVPIGTVVAFGGLVGWVAFYSMDVHWYHLFLRAAGAHAARIEARWKDKFPELLLSTQIRENSNRPVFGLKSDSTRRLTFFYAVGGIVLLITGIVVWVAHPANQHIPAASTAAAPATNQSAAPPSTQPSLASPTTTDTVIRENAAAPSLKDVPASNASPQTVAPSLTGNGVSTNQSAKKP